MVTLGARSCVARQEPYIPGALSILKGTVPGRVRGSGHMVPTYFRRELRDRALQRRLRLRTFFLLAHQDRSFAAVVPRHRVSPPASPMTGSSGIPQYAASSRFYRNCSGILDHPLSRVMTVGEGNEATHNAPCPRRPYR